jgi:hypothetical protein
VLNGSDVTYPDLAKKIEEEWKSNGSHRAASDKNLDRAVLHADNSTEFAHVIAVLDAIYSPQREWAPGGGTPAKIPAFSVTFAAD